MGLTQLLMPQCFDVLKRVTFANAGIKLRRVHRSHQGFIGRRSPTKDRAEK